MNQSTPAGQLRSHSVNATRLSGVQCVQQGGFVMRVLLGCGPTMFSLNVSVRCENLVDFICSGHSFSQANRLKSICICVQNWWKSLHPQLGPPSIPGPTASDSNAQDPTVA